MFLIVCWLTPKTFPRETASQFHSRFLWTQRNLLGNERVSHFETLFRQWDLFSECQSWVTGYSYVPTLEVHLWDRGWPTVRRCRKRVGLSQNWGEVVLSLRTCAAHFTRRYRNSLKVLDRAQAKWKEENISLILQLGDIIDGLAKDGVRCLLLPVLSPQKMVSRALRKLWKKFLRALMYQRYIWLEITRYLIIMNIALISSHLALQF